MLRAQALAARLLEAATIAAKRAARAAKAQRTLSEKAQAHAPPEGPRPAAAAESDDGIVSLFDDEMGAHCAVGESGGGGSGGGSGAQGACSGEAPSHTTVPLGEALRKWKGKKPKELLADLVRGRKWPAPTYRRWHVGTAAVAASVTVHGTEYAPSALAQAGDRPRSQQSGDGAGLAAGTCVCATPAEAEQLAAVSSSFRAAAPERRIIGH